MEQYHGTTILSVRRGKRVAMGGDGQVTLGNIVIKAGARKVRRSHKGDILSLIHIEMCIRDGLQRIVCMQVLLRNALRIPLRPAV